MNIRILLLVSAIPCSSGFGTRPGSHQVHPYRNRSRLRLSGGDENENDVDSDSEKVDNKDEREGLTWDELMSDPELRQMEFDSSMKRRNAMFLPQRISAAVTTLGWLFVGGGIILNALGFAWVRDPSGGIKVGTMDEREFQKEVMRERRRGMEEEKAKLSVSQRKDTNSIISGWLEEQDSRST